MGGEKMSEDEVNNLKLRLGWLPDYPSIRDYTKDQDKVATKLQRLGQKDSVKAMLNKVGVLKAAPTETQATVDLRVWCSPVEDQGNLGSCTAHAGVGLVEYFEKKAFGNHLDASRLFLYKVTRNLLHWKGDTGAFLRSTMESMVLFGIPPEEYCPYKISDFDVEPSAFLYSFADNYKTIQYYRFDPPGVSKTTLLQTIKTYLSAGLPSMFGFTVYDSIDQAATTGKIPYPAPKDKVAGGHAVDAVGYDDNISITNKNPGGKTTKGALLIRNSWGPTWGGMGGYLWLPYDYVLSGLATDWWSVLKNEWIDTDQFKSPT
jgi:C1A family cysteine protease